MYTPNGRPTRKEWSRPSRLILASSSPRRRDLLGTLGVAFDVVAAEGVDEDSVRGTGRTVASTLARLKAEEVLGRLARGGGVSGEDLVVLGGDTVVVLGEEPGEILGKPRDAGDARAMLRRLAGRAHAVWTGVALARKGVETRVEAEETRIAFRRLSSAEIDAYIATGDFEGKAGAYGIQGAGASLVEGFEGCYYNVVGLPLRRVARLLEAAGIPAAGACDCSSRPLQRGGAGCA